MKPNFALDLSHDGVELLHRHPSGWESLGAARFDHADLDARLAALRQKAAERAPDGLFCKLVLPAGEMRFASVLAPGPTDEARKLQIETEIDGLTPYSADELAYDFVSDGDHVQVAMAAREILAEAEAFAVNHGFNPVSFVARSKEGAFQREPFLGVTEAAAQLIPTGERVEPDAEPVRLAEQSRASQQVEKPQAQPVALQAASGGGGRARRPDPPGPARSPRPRVEITPGEPKSPYTKSGSSPFETSELAGNGSMSKVGNLVRRMGNRLRREHAQESDNPPSDKSAATAEWSGKGQGVDTAGGDSKETVKGSPAIGQIGASLARFRPGGVAPGAEPDQGEREARTRDGQGSGQKHSQTGHQPDVQTRSDTDAPSEGQAGPVAFSTRRRAAPQLATSSARSSSPGPEQGPGGRLAILPEGRGRKTDDRPKGAQTKSMKSVARKLTRRAKKAAKRLALAVPMPSVRATERLSPSAEAGDKAAPLLSRLSRSPASTETPEPIVPESRPPADQAAKASEAEALTIFGARGSQGPQRALPRRGLIAAGGIALLLGAVAIWALYFMGGVPRGTDIAATAPDSTTESAAAPGIEAPEALPAPDSAPVPVITPDTAPEGAVPEGDTPPAADTTDETATGPAPDQADPAALLEQLVEDGLRELAPAEMLGRIDPAEPVPATPGEAADAGAAVAPAEDDAAISPSLSDDAAPSGATALGFPAPVERPAGEETPFAAIMPPPPFGVSFDIGPDGLVEATPEGALTPAGVTVFAGRPAEVPPTRPGGAVLPEAAAEPEPQPETGPEAAATEPEADAAEVVADDTPRADPALADARPEPRSSRVAEIGEALARERQADETDQPAGQDTETPAMPDPDDSGALIGPGGVSLAALQPQRRPTDLVPPATAEAEAATETVAREDDAETRAEVVARSLMPSSRPAGLEERVAELLAVARTSPEPAAAAPSTAAPRIPTSASVAEQATERGLNLRQVNLIGVYGTSSDRRALVRLSNGRIVRVAVGDRLDGGQVAAIGDAELRYVRNGRNEVLRIGGRS